jgi:hypothetical protein
MHVTTESAPGTEGAEGKKISVKAIVISQYGGPEVLKLQDVEIGIPGRGQALVRLAMAGGGVKMLRIMNRVSPSRHRQPQAA